MHEKTQRLYFQDPYQRKFSARVLERTLRGEHPALLLDQTCFYPESGGQPADSGTLNGVCVLDVFEEGERIYHVCEGDVPGDEVEGEIDWERRFDHMQQHAGQHLISQGAVRLFGATTLSFHLGKEASTVELDKASFSDEEAGKLEELANRAVFENREIRCRFLSEEEVDAVPLRKPPKKKGVIRVVEVADFDWTACGGTHPRSTGEIGIIKILRWDRIRGHVRLEFVCGKRALRDYARKHRDLRDLSNRLTIDDREILPAFERILQEVKDQKKLIKKLKKELIQHQAEKMIQQTEKPILQAVFTDRTIEDLRHLALTIIKKGAYIVLFGLRKEDRGHMILACSETLDLDLRDLVPELTSLIRGKGGGRASLVEIVGERKENLEAALQKASEMIQSRFT